MWACASSTTPPLSPWCRKFRKGTGLKLEITESRMMDQVDETIARMNLLKGHHLAFSLNDFGTEYSSLSHLRRLPLDQLKIDRSFVMDMLTDVRNASIVRTILMLGQNLQLTVIAEDYPIYQGYLFSPALTAARFEDFVATAATGPTRDAA
jgi:predicted signal transduction protein with EAL and GGDEF domain